MHLLTDKAQFLIHSDFDTSASRQDIATTSRRNIDLLDDISAAFVKAVLQFCEHPKLCYTWPRFLPSTDIDSSPFWSGLTKRIKSLLLNTPVLKSLHGNDLRKTGDVVILKKNAKDERGDPLFDRWADVFLSKQYASAERNALRQYGLKLSTFNLLFDMLHYDLSHRESRMKSDSTSQAWHSAAAKLISRSFVRRAGEEILRLNTLSLLPLMNGQWVSPDSGQVYFPTTQGIPIPRLAGMRLLDSTAVANVDRKALFSHLGVVEARIADVRTSILRAYERFSPWAYKCFSPFVNITESKAHLHYLYLTHQPNQARDELRQVRILSHDGRVGIPHEEDFYLPRNHAYGPEALLKPADDAPGLQVSFVHQAYLEEEPNPPTATHPSWENWLCDFVGVRKRMRLVSRSGNSLADTFTYVAEHRGDKFLGHLKYLWKYERSHVKNNVSLRTEIRNTFVINRRDILGPRFSWALDDSFLPFPLLQEQCQRYMEPTERFPFLELGGPMSAEELSTKWMFLHTIFSAGKEDNVHFLLQILGWIRDSHEEASSVTRFQRLFDLYVAIDAKCLGAIDRQAARNSIK